MGFAGPAGTIQASSDFLSEADFDAKSVAKAKTCSKFNTQTRLGNMEYEPYQPAQQFLARLLFSVIFLEKLHVKHN
ncbi:hypothetical protein QQP08_010682 [Theobroma cacao]|uniref:Uncharacterized protein n=1 Tax=Theobroma cacao TaxID=3641 RepID=A0A061G6Y4_THECC|nr:Uncharacterized protein TCM_016679 [Theobroma cacao]WRX18195.1 hypothetical protein QQP08_010682 [Theobroma cacao]